ncbi:hypothetical protein K2173_011998 [Erythroxylum novogranatense]|uniref:Domain X domain-containing protein n=1 Tax=Erythroxylum novogranatense TaxID=1862640 RepID=A0AAV8TFX8_9ROSI|nr:hypothetical protein K2173_011998 [Erythroxylum novogranatense]
MEGESSCFLGDYHSMWLVGLRSLYVGYLARYVKLQRRNLCRVDLLLSIPKKGVSVEQKQAFTRYSAVPERGDIIRKGSGTMTLAKDLACLIEESSEPDKRRPKSRMELKRSLELSIKKRVKEQYKNGKFQDLVENVIANPQTLEDAYNCVRLNSNVDVASTADNISFESLAEELLSGNFDFKASSSTISSKGEKKETLVLPKLKLKVVQEAIRIVLEVVYRPHFSKISHGCRSGRGHHTATKYIKKEISNINWWFTLIINKTMDTSIFDRLITIMEDKIEDPCLYNLLRSMFDADVINVDFGGFPKGHGLPQEGVLSPILINIYLDMFDREFFRLSMKYEALCPGLHSGEAHANSKLRSWFRRQLKGNDITIRDDNNSGPRIHCCRFMDELFFAVSGTEEVAHGFRTDVVNFLHNSLYLDVDFQTEILPGTGPQGIRFLGTLVKRTVRESPAFRVVHKLKHKVKLFASQKEEAWDIGTVRIGKKWLAHGLKKVKESEIKHLADSSSTLSQISCFRKPGMKTDHWYKYLLKIWMQDVKAKLAKSQEFILSKHAVEPAIPQELRDSYYEFQKQAEEYVQSETAATLDLLKDSSLPAETITRILAPVNEIQKRLLRYGLITSQGHSCMARRLILQDDSHIIDWFSGIAHRWLRWYSHCDNFEEIMLIMRDQVRKSCIRTLAAKYRIHEIEIEKKFDLELSRIPSTQEIEHNLVNEVSNSATFGDDEALSYGISYSGVCLLSLARKVSQSRPCYCFVMGCSIAAPNVYTLHVMERQKFPAWKTGFSTCIHPSLNKRRIGLCKQHLKDIYVGNISLQSIDFSSWK